MKAIYWKELRETLRWSPIGMLLMAALIWTSLPGTPYQALFRPLDTHSAACFGAALIALGLGVLQSLGDARQASRGFLLHRPLSPSSIFWGKLLSGLTVYSLAMVPGVLLGTAFLEIKGPTALPTSGIQMLPLVLCITAIFLIHPASLWMCYREGTWIKNKWIPLAATALGVWAMVMWLATLSWGISLALGACMSIAIAVTVIAGARHAFVRQSFSPAASSDQSRSWPDIIATICVTATLIGFLWVTAYGMFRSRPHYMDMGYQTALDSQGRLWQLRFPLVGGRVDPNAKLQGRRVQSQASADYNTLDDDLKWMSLAETGISQGADPQWFRPFTYVMNLSQTPFGSLAIYLHEGVLYGYNTNGLATKITPQGIFSANEPAQGRFSNLKTVTRMSAQVRAWVSYSLFDNYLLLDDSGVYQLNFDTQSLDKLVEGPIDQAAFAPPVETQGALLWTVSDQQVRAYHLQPVESDQTLPLYSDRVVQRSSGYPLPRVSAELFHSWELTSRGDDPPSQPGWGLLSTNNQAILAATHQTYALESQFTLYDAESNVLDSGSTPRTRDADLSIAEAWGVPPGVVAGFLMVAGLTTVNPALTFAAITAQLVYLGLHSLLALAVTAAILVIRSPGTRARWGWIAAAAILGLCVPMAMLLLHRRIVREPCQQCDRQRRVDLEKCPHCGAPWDPVQREGYEIIGPQTAEPQPLLG